MNNIVFAINSYPLLNSVHLGETDQDARDEFDRFYSNGDVGVIALLIIKLK